MRTKLAAWATGLAGGFLFWALMFFVFHVYACNVPMAKITVTEFDGTGSRVHDPIVVLEHDEVHLTPAADTKSILIAVE